MTSFSFKQSESRQCHGLGKKNFPLEVRKELLNIKENSSIAADQVIKKACSRFKKKVKKSSKVKGEVYV